MEYIYNLKLQAQSNTIDDLLHTMDEVKEQIATGYAMAHNKNEKCSYALNLDKEEQGNSNK